MKKIFGFAMVMAVVVMPVVSLAAEFRTGKQPSVNANEQISNDLYIAGGVVTSAGSVSGDLVAAGGNLAISGNVGADVIVAGGNVNIFANVGDDVRAAGGSVIVQGRVGGDVIAGGGQITIGGAGVGGDVAIGGGDISINAPVSGKLTVQGGNVFINAPIAGDINIEADSVTLGSAAVIDGNMTYKAGSELVKDPSAVVNGKVTFEQRAGKTFSPVVLRSIISAFLVWQFFALLACALLVGLMFRRFGKEILKLAQERPLFELGRGLIALASIFVISILLFVTVVGIPLGLLGFLGFFALILFAWMLTPIIVGSFVYRYFSKKDLEVNWKTITTGVIACTILGLVPFIGWLILKLLLVLTFGCIVSLKLSIVKEWR